MCQILIIVFCVIATVACNPVEQKLGVKKSSYPFLCLASQSSCLVETEAGRFTVKFSGLTEQDKVKTELPFQISLALSEVDKSHKIHSVESFLEGQDMFMGKVPVFFKANTADAQTYIAESLLASCSEEVMRWRLWLKVDIIMANEVKQQSFYIDFDSIRL